MARKSLEEINSIDVAKYNSDVEYRKRVIKSVNAKEQEKRRKAATKKKITDNIAFQSSEKEISKSSFNRDKRQLEETRARIKRNEDIKQSSKELLEYTPIIGDAMQLKDVYNYIQENNRPAAGLALTGMFIPNVLEKPLRTLGKVFRKSLKKNKYSYLDWSNWSKGGEISQKHLDEYRKIEEKAKLDGTWLKNEDGSDFKGDAHTWVQMQSEDFKRHYDNTIYYSGVGKGREIDSTYNGEQWASTSGHRARTYASNDDYVEELAIPKDSKITTYDAKNRNWRAVEIDADGNRITTNDIRDRLLKDEEYLEIDRVQDYGPRNGMFDGKKESPRYSKHYNEKENKAFEESFTDEDFYKHYDEPSNLVFGKGAIRKSLLHNNGNFDINNLNKYMSFAPFILFTNNNKNN